MSSINQKTAEQSFREAFERLKSNRPKLLAQGAPITQNNVAREAGRDPSALKKSRYPLLISEIQAFTASEREQKKEKKRATDNRSRTLQKRLADSQKQVGKLSSIVAAQQDLIAELLDDIARLKDSKFIPLGNNR